MTDIKRADMNAIIYANVAVPLRHFYPDGYRTAL